MSESGGTKDGEREVRSAIPARMLASRIRYGIMYSSSSTPVGIPARTSASRDASHCRYSSTIHHSGSMDVEGAIAVDGCIVFAFSSVK